MDIDLDLYKIFYTVAKHKHMTKASEELYISQPAISQSIKKLEEQLGGTLFIRSNKGMELTSEGKMFFEHIKGALELINNAENEFSSFKSLDKGEIKIGCSSTLTKLVLLDAIKEFHKDYPGVKVTIINDLTSNLINNLKLGKLDMVIFNESNVKESNLSLVKIKELKQGFIYNKDYFKDNIKTLSELNDYPLILQKEESNSRKLLDYLTMQKGIKLIPNMEVVSQDLITEFTNIGLGIGFSIIDLAKNNYPHLEELNVNREIPNINVYLASNRNISLTFASKKFIQYLEKYNV
jgi:DNA-binding transcriptional LysR family regulator